VCVFYEKIGKVTRKRVASGESCNKNLKKKNEKKTPLSVSRRDCFDGKKKIKKLNERGDDFLSVTSEGT
jgi:hypothetical protein